MPNPVLKDGDRMPRFTLKGDDGSTVTNASLRGKPYVLYFYPADDTPACTAEACDFQTALPSFRGLPVMGVSPDSAERHAKFRAKYGLTFPLLVDADQKVSTRLGVWRMKKNYGREYLGIVRSTFLIDGKGIIRKIWDGVKVKGHAETVKATFTALGLTPG